MVGVVKCMPVPNVSRLPAWVLLYSSDMLVALKAYKTAGDPLFTAHTIPFVEPRAEIEGVAPLPKEGELFVAEPKNPPE
jgi:hypothetical protein